MTPDPDLEINQLKRVQRLSPLISSECISKRLNVDD
jgi:hypothetical protein